jgi:hypothetical protein
MKNGRLDEIITEQRSAHNLPDKVTISKQRIERRCQRGNEFVEHGATKGGNISPLIPLEPFFVMMLILLSKIRLALKASEAVRLFNSLIEGTKHQQEVIEYKKRYCYAQAVWEDADALGTIGLGYFNRFMHRNEDKLVSKRGHKYELDRASWTKYQIFKQMYDCVADALIEAGLAILMQIPVWMDREGNEVSADNDKKFGMKVGLKIIKPECCLCADEVGCNTCMRGDGHVGGAKKICERGCVPYKLIGKKDKHFTCLGFTNFLGEPILCVVIVTGKEYNFTIEGGIDCNMEMIGYTRGS